MRGRPPTVCDCVCRGKARIHRGETGFYVRCEFDPGLAKVPTYSTPRKAISTWNAAQQGMDNVTRNTVCAYHTGKSYGYYVAEIPVEPPVERYPKKEEDAKIPVLRCVCCGMLIPAECRSKKYCSQECAEAYRKEQRRIRELQQQEEPKQKSQPEPPAKPKRVCILCGKPIPAYENKRKYCSAACADEAMTQQRRLSNKRAREKQRLNKNDS